MEAVRRIDDLRFPGTGIGMIPGESSQRPAKRCMAVDDIDMKFFDYGLNLPEGKKV